jgi:glyoxylate reductase
VARIFVTRKIPLWDEVSKPLYEAGHEVVVSKENHRMASEDLVKEIEKGYDALLTLLTDEIDAEILAHDKQNQLKQISNYAVGFDNINVADCTARNIIVTNTPCDEVNESVAEFSWTLILALARRLPEAGEFMRNAAYTGWDPGVFIGTDLNGKTLGIVGMGRIGGMVAKRAEGFGMKILYYNRKAVDPTSLFGASLGEGAANLEFVPKLDDLLARADVVSLHVPLTPETQHLINGKNLPLFKKGAILINTARGPVVNEEEVAEALRAGMISGYGADVFENEPDPYPELLQMENVILTPHIASATVSARRAMGKSAVLNLVEGLGGRTPPNLVVFR